jgi:hypothetical protein
MKQSSKKKEEEEEPLLLALPQIAWITLLLVKSNYQYQHFSSDESL